VQDYYQILGLSQTATSAQIRAAFKRLAMQYHPDRNPNNPMAEEIFKRVNEAYHILSDPLKKARYDSRFYTYETQSSTQAAEEHWRDVRRRQQQQARRQYAPQAEKTYTITGNYFKIQGLAFLVFIILSGISFGIVHIASFLFNRHLESVHRENILKVKEANTLFGAGKIDEAITQIISLNRKSPMEVVFRNAHDSLIHEIGSMAEQNFASRNFERALYYYQYFKKYQDHGQTETLEKIAVCQYNTAMYPEALQSLKQLHSEKPWSLELIYDIVKVNLNHLNNTTEAMFYLNLGEKTFRDNMEKIYGEAFMVMMDPKDIPDLYYEIFIAKAQLELKLKDYKEAEPDLELAIYLRPARFEGYQVRAELNIEQQRYRSACTDLRKAKELGATEISALQSKYCQ
jgi:tetratricopeptide (TPR) repeat protein